MVKSHTCCPGNALVIAPFVRSVGSSVCRCFQGTCRCGRLRLLLIFRLGFETERVPFVIPEDWTPSDWQASYSIDGKTTALESAFPVGKTAPTPEGGISAEAVWVGVGSEADFLGRDVKGKAVVVYSTFVPGGRSHSASRRARIFNANERASKLGAAMIINVMAVPGDARFNPLGAPSADYGVPLITINQDEGYLRF